MNDTIGDRIKKFRKAKGYSQKEFGELLGVSNAVISNWERGTSNPSVETLRKMCDLLEIKADDLFGGLTYAEPLPFNRLVIPDKENIADRYYSLDEHGREAVRSILEVEHRRMAEAKNKATIIPMRDANVNEKPITLTEVDYYSQPAGMGRGFDVYDAVPEKIEIDVDKLPEGTDFVIRVIGDSMEPTYSSGDKLFVKKTNTLEHGDIGVFNLEGEQLVKEYGNGELISHNKKYKPIEAANGCYIQGKVLGKYEE